MARYSAKCAHVEDGDTFQTAKGTWIRLAGVNTPEKNESGWQKAKGVLEKAILGRDIVYESVGKSYGRIVAEVWCGNTHVNEYMRGHGY